MDKEKKRKVSFTGVFFNVRRWIALDDVLMNSRFLKKTFKDLYSPDVKKPSDETFEEMMSRLQLTDKDLDKRKSFLLRASIFYFLCSLGLFGYMFYLVFIGGHVFALIMTFILAILLLEYAFREHFFYMQISKRRLDCKLKDWIAFILRRSN